MVAELDFSDTIFSSKRTNMMEDLHKLWRFTATRAKALETGRNTIATKVAAGPLSLKRNTIWKVLRKSRESKVNSYSY